MVNDTEEEHGCMIFDDDVEVVVFHDARGAKVFPDVGGGGDWVAIVGADISENFFGFIIFDDDDDDNDDFKEVDSLEIFTGEAFVIFALCVLEAGFKIFTGGTRNTLEAGFFLDAGFEIFTCGDEILAEVVSDRDFAGCSDDVSEDVDMTEIFLVGVGDVFTADIVEICTDDDGIGVIVNVGIFDVVADADVAACKSYLFEKKLFY